jgi:ribonuclease P protein component
VSRKIGGAVVRNRIRRRIREISLVLDALLLRKLDLVIVARKGINNAPYWDLMKDIEQVCRKARFIREGEQVEDRKPGV